jgi:hypothetical protein
MVIDSAMPHLPIAGKAHEAAPGAPFTWFIYGSSLDREAFSRWADEHGYRLPDFSGAKPARLEGHRLCFDVASRFWGGAVASVAEAPGRSVEGVALPMPGEARGLVDHREGAISGLYLPFAVTVQPLSGGAAMPAVAYRTNPARRLPQEAPPAPAYLEILLKGAQTWKLSASHLAELERLKAG